MTPQIPPRLPSVALLLGYGGLIPFWALALLPGAVAKALPFSVADALLLYGALIVTFVGAISWGIALVHPHAAPELRSQLLIYSVLPSLICFATLVWQRGPAQGHDAASSGGSGVGLAAAVLIAVALLALRQDRRLSRRLAMPEGFLRLRLHLTVGAALGLAVGAVRTSAGLLG